MALIQLASDLLAIAQGLRAASLQVSIQGTDVSADLSPYLLSMSYTSKSDGELDDMQLVLEDRDALWQGDWLPKPGNTLSVTLFTENFLSAGDRMKLECGDFEIDELTLDSSRDGGDTVTIKAVPACAKSSLFREKKTRAWSDTPMKTVCADIVNPAGLDLLYKAPDIKFSRVEQREESDLEFLQRIVSEQGLRLTLKSQMAVVYSGASADALDPIAISRWDPAYGVSSVSFKYTLDSVYKGSALTYTDSQDGEENGAEFTPENAPETGKTLRINKKLENRAQGERVAQAELRAANCKEFTATLDSIGNPMLTAGVVLELSGWGAFSQKYCIQQATHTVSRDAGYRTSCELVKALDY